MLPLPNADDPSFLLWRDEPSLTPPEEVLVLGIVPPPPADPAPIPVEPPVTEDAPPPPAAALAAAPEPAPPAAAPAPSAPPAPAEPPPPEATPLAAAPAFDLPPEDAFPTPAELDAILAANAWDPPGPSLDERAAVVALLGLDPAIATDPLLYAETLAHLPEPGPAQVLAQWMHDYGVEAAPADPSDSIRDWQIG